MLVIDNCQSFTISGFTYDEAKRYFTNKKIKFDDIYSLTGTNPLLIHANLKAKDIGVAKRIVETRVQRYMVGNLKISKQDSPKKLSEYFVEQELAKIINFVYCACRCGEMTDKELNKY